RLSVTKLQILPVHIRNVQPQRLTFAIPSVRQPSQHPRWRGRWRRVCTWPTRVEDLAGNSPWPGTPRPGENSESPSLARTSANAPSLATALDGLLPEYPGQLARTVIGT